MNSPLLIELSRTFSKIVFRSIRRLSIAVPIYNEVKKTMLSVEVLKDNKNALKVSFWINYFFKHEPCMEYVKTKKFLELG